MTHLDRAKSYLRAIELDELSAEAFFAPDVVQREFPNRLVPSGATRDLAALREASHRGKKAVTQQHYEITNAVEQGDQLALEVEWTAKLNLPVGNLPAGGVLRAHFGVFFRFRDGLIVTQHNYDCFDPF
jgi:ketosteroid isomerase-like protein